ncbi:Rhodanese-like protein [Haematococcus lacustris]
METRSLPYISADALVSRLEAEKGHGSTVVLDVRDDDREGGHINGSIHVPSSTLTDAQLDEVIEKHISATSPEAVVVHCMFSQQRGPRAAARLAARLSEMESKTQVLVLQGGFVGFNKAASAKPHLLADICPS